MIFGAGGASRAAVYAMTKWLNCSPICASLSAAGSWGFVDKLGVSFADVVNRDDNEVNALIADFKKNASESFDPKLVHIKTIEEAESLPAPGSALSSFRF